jgi:hypothetical protein
LAELASSSAWPRRLRVPSSSTAPSNGAVSPIIAMYWSCSAARMASPCSCSTSSLETAATSWSPPMPMCRWMRQIGTVTWCCLKARYQAMAWW